MTASRKFLFFIIALCAMLCLAAGSVLMALKNIPLTVLFFFIAVVIMATGFTLRRRWQPRRM